MASLGQQPILSSVTRRWATDLGLMFDPQLPVDEQLQQIVARLNQSARPFLLIIDDVWATADAQPFLLASPHLSLLITSRQRDAIHSVDLGDLVGSTICSRCPCSTRPRPSSCCVNPPSCRLPSIRPS